MIGLEASSTGLYRQRRLPIKNGRPITISISYGRWPLMLATPSPRIGAGDGMALKDGLPKFGCVVCPKQKAEVPIEWIKGTIIDPGEPGPMVFRRFGKAG